MDQSQLQAKIDALTWYHEFDFGNDLQTRTHSPDIQWHRKLWAFMENMLNSVSFHNKTVLDIGCWDGYWSFYAERRGAAAVLATDDFTQNWSSAQGVFLAKDLLGSAIDINPRLSVYNLASLNRKFDVILFLGVYYHLWDPFYALAQIRHCCHPETILIVDGTVASGLPPHAIYFSAIENSKFTPTVEALNDLLSASYFRTVAHALMDPEHTPAQPALVPPPGRLGWRWRLLMCLEALKGSRPGIKRLGEMVLPSPSLPPQPSPARANRIILQCAPREETNEIHKYAPPFGLHVYDNRFRDLVVPAAAA